MNCEKGICILEKKCEKHFLLFFSDDYQDFWKFFLIMLWPDYSFEVKTDMINLGV